jgi:polysaccharide pyruvyl transferase WcaK-like protein
MNAITGSHETGKEGTLVIAAFLGRGNAGDEAMLQVLFETFSPRFNIVISVDMTGAFPGFWDWYPYAQAKVVHQNDCHAIERIRDLVGMVVGGGALSLGFAAGQVLVAKARGVPVAFASVDVWTPTAELHAAVRGVLDLWLGLFDLIVTRTARSVTKLNDLGLGSVYAADFALRLPTDNSPAVRVNEPRALVVLREGIPGMANEEFAAWAVNLLVQLQVCGYRVVLLPFCPEDDRFLAELDLCDRFEVERIWWNARQLKQLIASSALTVTVGRLHPMIFAAPTGRNVAVLRPPQWMGKRAGQMRKLTDMAEELGIDVFETIDDLIATLRDGRVRQADPVHRDSIPHVSWDIRSYMRGGGFDAWSLFDRFTRTRAGGG